MIIQILCGLYILDKNGLYHGDLNIGNILYTRSFNNKDKEYIKYNYDGKTFYVKHFGAIYVLWDFEYVNNKGNRLHENFTPEYLSYFFSDNVMRQMQMLWGNYKDKDALYIPGSWIYDMIIIIRSIRSIFKFNNKIYMVCNKIYGNLIDLFLKNDMNLNPIQCLPNILNGVQIEDDVITSEVVPKDNILTSLTY